MSDVVLVQNGIAHEIWRGKTIDAMRASFTPDLVVQMVEVASDTVNDGDVFNGTNFLPPPAPPPKPAIVAYAAFRDKWTDAEKAALHTAMTSSWQIDDFVGLARAQNSVNLSGATATQAKSALVTAGVLTQERADTLFNPATYAA